MALSSINFQKVSVHSFKHNDRTEVKTAATVFTEKSDLNICDVAAKTAKQNLDLFYKESISKVTGKTRRAQKKNVLIEAAVNIKPNTTMEDLKKLQAHIEKEFGFKGLQIAIHRDEGHYEDGKFVTNQHAHMSFFTLNRETGRQMFRREHITKEKLSQLQDKTAELLVMDRGQKAELTGRKRLSHKDYKQSKKQELAKVKDLKEEISKLRAELKENKATREDYANLEQLNRELKVKIKAKDLTIEDLQEKINTLKDEFFKGNEAYEEVRQDNYFLKEENQELKNANKALQEQKKTLEHNVSTLEEKSVSRTNMSDYEAILQENERLKEENSKLEKKYNTNFQKIVELNKELDAAAKTPSNLFSWIKTKFEEFKEQILGLETERNKLINKIKALELENDELLEEVNKYKFQLSKEELDAIDLESDYFKSLPQEQQKVINEQIIENYNKELELEKTLSNPNTEELSKEELAELQEEAEEYKKSISKEDISKASQELRKEINENKGQELSI